MTSIPIQRRLSEDQRNQLKLEGMTNHSYQVLMGHPRERLGALALDIGFVASVNALIAVMEHVGYPIVFVKKAQIAWRGRARGIVGHTNGDQLRLRDHAIAEILFWGDSKGDIPAISSEQNRVDAYAVQERLRLLKFVYGEPRALPYLAVGISSESAIRNAIENCIDADLMASVADWQGVA